MSSNNIADWITVEYSTVDLVIRQVIIVVFETNHRACKILWLFWNEETQTKDFIETATFCFEKVNVW